MHSEQFDSVSHIADEKAARGSRTILVTKGIHHILSANFSMVKGSANAGVASYPVSLVESLVPTVCACAIILQKTV